MEMTQNMKDKVGLYVALAKYIAPSVDDVYGVAILREIGKDMRCDQVVRQNGHKNAQAEDVPATDKQIAYLHDLGVTFTDGLTKKSASELIENAKSIQPLMTQRAA